MFAYTHRDDFWHRLHPASVLLVCAGLFFPALIFSHPLYLLVLAAAAVAGTASSGGKQTLRQLLRLAGPLVGTVILFNVLISRSGQTALVSGLPFSREALAYGTVMGLRLFTLLAGWAVFSLTVPIEELLGHSRLFSGRAGLVISLGVRLFPLLLEEQRRITEAMRSRGVRFAGIPWSRRLANSLAVWQPLLLTTLERSWQLGEAMLARGYVGGRRYPWHELAWQQEDKLVLAGLAVTLGAAIGALATGAASFTFYPAAESPFNPTALRWLPFLAAGLFWPSLLAWRWRYGPDRDS